MKTKRLPYVSPTIEVICLEMEEGIASGSGAKVTIGSGSSPNTPEVEDWQVGTGSTQDTYL